MPEPANTAASHALETAWSELLAAASKVIELDPDASSQGRRTDLFTVVIWPADKHDLDGMGRR